ncbi:DUF4142 domain-containing protein [Aquincola sp. J276]|uniref:DUF4142 domain-containing protein n=1 Tax=Aquincola sp. J276 TaxID=2898432 RepID=UPI0021507F31|nr:DUF4142 domain-containing protein [Aquincola sp. J276]MCR5868598.1 DUF4142 domain-containing protein [Aquincola sp. J276]
MTSIKNKPFLPTSQRPLAGLLIVAAGLLAAGCDRGAPNTDANGMAPNTPAASGVGPGVGNSPTNAGAPPPDSPENSRTGSRVGIPQGSPEAGMATPENTPTTGGVGAVAPSPGAAASAAPPASGTSSTAPGPAVPLSASEKAFMAAAHVAGLYEIEVGRIGAERAQDTKVKALAGHLVSEHSVANDALRGLAALRNVELPTSLPPDRQADIDKLKKAPAAQFDETMVQAVVIPAHQDDIARFERAQQDARDPELKAFIQRTLPTLHQHLKSAQTLALPPKS